MKHYNNTLKVLSIYLEPFFIEKIHNKNTTVYKLLTFVRIT